ncbi:hypothetical protein N431DRAFT_349285 [Stipitochalara longipes BDJ]|nr:hypothetical protein N431DRAFT_349285 [Stipitochalara longipes BDJ]
MRVEKPQRARHIPIPNYDALDPHLLLCQNSPSYVSITPIPDANVGKILAIWAIRACIFPSPFTNTYTSELGRSYSGYGYIKRQSRIVTIVSKALHAIFKWLDPCTATLLGVTCRKLYRFYKYRYTEKISLCERDSFIDQNGNNRCFSLGEKLVDWMGPAYRLKDWDTNTLLRKHAEHPPQFLAVTVYGSTRGGLQEVELQKRYIQYNSAQRVIDGQTKFLLPPPFNKSEKEWVALAKEVIKKDAEVMRGKQEWDWQTWLSCWEASEVFDALSYMDKLRVLQRLEYLLWCHKLNIDPGQIQPLWDECLRWDIKRLVRWFSHVVVRLPAHQPLPRPYN